MDIQTARAILSEVAAGNWLDKDIPEGESDVIDLAQYYVEEAQLAIKEGMDNDHLHAIINLSKLSPPVLSELAESPNIEGSPPGEITQYDTGYQTIDMFDKDYDGLPIPRAIPEDALEMPTDLTEVGDKAVRRLYSAFNSYLGRARWKLALSLSNQANATHLRDESYRVAFLKAFKASKAEGEKLSQAVLEQFAQETEDYKNWSEKVREHTDEVTSWRALVDIYGGNVDRLSREWTMRTEQYERER